MIIKKIKFPIFYLRTRLLPYYAKVIDCSMWWLIIKHFTDSRYNVRLIWAELYLKDYIHYNKYLFYF